MVTEIKSVLTPEAIRRSIAVDYKPIEEILEAANRRAVVRTTQADVWVDLVSPTPCGDEDCTCGGFLAAVLPRLPTVALDRIAAIAGEEVEHSGRNDCNESVLLARHCFVAMGRYQPRLAKLPIVCSPEPRAPHGLVARVTCDAVKVLVRWADERRDAVLVVMAIAYHEPTAAAMLDASLDLEVAPSGVGGGLH